MADIQIHNLATGYRATRGRQVAVAKPFDATLRAGQLTSLLGPNGAGKSTLIKTIAALTPRLDGEIFFDGRDISDYSSSQLAALIAVVLTDRLMLPNMTVRDLVALGRSPYTGFSGRQNDTDQQAVERALLSTGTHTLAHRAVNTLSDGERQKVMIAKSLAQDTPVILLDEPTAFLDFPSKVDTLRLLHRIAHNDNKAILMSTHDLELALQISDTLWLTDKELGTVSGNARELADNGLINKYFDRDGVHFNPRTGHFDLQV